MVSKLPDKITSHLRYYDGIRLEVEWVSDWLDFPPFFLALQGNGQAEYVLDGPQYR